MVVMERPAMEVAPDPRDSAREAGLRYVSDARPGIRRVPRGDGFAYVGPRGEPIQDDIALERISSLRIPPAWTEVWICPIPNGHIQATGRDARGRKQYVYHPRWHEVRDATKFGRMIAFGQALPEVRRQVSRDLARPNLPRAKVIAALVHLLESTLIRIGNEEYARANESFGLTTLREEHANVRGSCVHFQFRGKKGRPYSVGFCDRRMAGLVRKLQDLPGQELFVYLDEQGEQRSVESDDVNGYLREITGEDFSAKDFRTWAATVLAAVAMAEQGSARNVTELKRNVAQAIKQTAEKLGNTPAVCRRSYVHPAIIEAYADGTLVQAFEDHPTKEESCDPNDLDPDESTVLQLLRERLQAALPAGH